MKKWGKDLNGHFTKKVIWMANKQKMLNIISH